MASIYKALFTSNDNEKILSTFINLLSKKNEKDGLKFLYELLFFSISENKKYETINFLSKGKI